MPLQEYCPYCNNLMTIPDGLTEIVCPHCQTILELSGPEEEQPPASAPPQTQADIPEQGAPRNRSKKKRKMRSKRSTGSNRPKTGTTMPADSRERGTWSTSSSRNIERQPPTRETDSRRQARMNPVRNETRPRAPEPPKTNLILDTEPVLNFVSDEDEQKTDSGSIPTDLSNIKIAAPVYEDNITGLITAPAEGQPAPPVVPDSETKTQEMSIPPVRIVGSSTEFRLDKDDTPSSSKIPPAPKPTPPPVDPQSKQKEEELRNLAEQARLEAEKARMELEQTRRLAEEERRRLESEKQALLAEQRVEEANRAEQQLRQQAEDARRQAEALKQQLAEKERAQQEQEAAKARAKEAALAKARERLIEEKKKQLIEEAKRRKAAETGAMSPVTAADPQTGGLPRKKKPLGHGQQKSSSGGKKKINLDALSKAARKRKSGK